MRKNSALIESNNKIQELENEISTLSPYKEAAEKAACEQAEAEKQEKIAELRDYVKKSNVFTKEELESEDISALISEMKATELKSMIADRIVGKQTATKETSSTKSQEKKRKKSTSTFLKTLAHLWISSKRLFSDSRTQKRRRKILLRYLQKQSRVPVEAAVAGEDLVSGAPIYKDAETGEIMSLATGLCDDLVDIRMNYDELNAVVSPTEIS